MADLDASSFPNAVLKVAILVFTVDSGSGNRMQLSNVSLGDSAIAVRGRSLVYTVAYLKVRSVVFIPDLSNVGSRSTPSRITIVDLDSMGHKCAL